MKAPRILVIAGSDSSGGAGISRDVATATAFGVEVCPVLTAVTAQTDQAVTAIHPVPPSIVSAQIISALARPELVAVKIGMLGSAEVAEAVDCALSGSMLPLVIDPVLRASSGGDLSGGGHLPALFSKADLLTPNLPEAAALTGLPEAVTPQEIKAQARALLAHSGAKAVLMKGGHGAGDLVTDWLVTDQVATALSAPRLPLGRRGTGCALATAIACRLALGDVLLSACQAAKSHIHQWIAGGVQ